MLTDQHLDALRSADRALTDATFRLAMAVDYAASVLPAWTLPTDVMKALDDYRETVAQMWPFFTAPEYVQQPESAITDVMKDGLCVICGALTTEYRETRDGLDWCCHEHAYQRPEPPSASTIAAVLAGPTQDQAYKWDDGEKWVTLDHRPTLGGLPPDEDEQATQDQDFPPRYPLTQVQVDNYLVNYTIGLLNFAELVDVLHLSPDKVDVLLKERVHMLSLTPEQASPEARRAFAAGQAEQATQDQEPLYSDERETWPNEQATPQPFTQSPAIMTQIERYERAALFGEDLSEAEYQALDVALSTSETMLEARRKAAEALQAEQATQDQEPLYSDERETWPNEQATPQPETEPCGFHGCLNPRKMGYSWCEEHIDAGLDEELRILTPELRCVCIGCQNPATVQIGEFWYCETHQADPIPF